MKKPPLRLLSVLLFPLIPAFAQPSTTSSSETMVNVATASLGAKGDGVGRSLLAGSQAVLGGGTGEQQALTVIELAGEVEMNRVALQVGTQKGKIRVVALRDDGTVDLSSGRVITEFTLDGSKTTVSADVGAINVKKVAIVWVPETPGQTLQVSNVGLFTSRPEPITQLPEVRALQQAAAATAPVATTTVVPTEAPATPPASTPTPSTSTPAATPANPAAPATPTASATPAAPATPAATPTASTPAPRPATTTPTAPSVSTTTATPVPPQTRNVSR